MFDGAAFLVQSVCADAQGSVIDRLPIPADCGTLRPQTVGDVAPYRRHDRPNAGADLPAGYQASDSVLWRTAERDVFVQTFDFGQAPRTFGRFDRGRGDGGQIMARIGAAYYAVFTEDGGAGRQWFVGPNCTIRPGIDRYNGWLLFRDDIVAGRWTQTLAHLNRAFTPEGCAIYYGPSLTRYRLERAPLPLMRAGETIEPVATWEMIVSEHYARGTVEASDHLERMVFAKGLGLVRWERWENLAQTNRPDAAETAAAFAATGRCPSWQNLPAPSAEWRVTDCREWLNLVPAEPGWSVSDYGWFVRSALEPVR